MPLLKTLISTTTLLALCVGAAQAEYPEKPITFIIGYRAGGSSDIAARTWAPYMEKCLGNGASILVEMRPGAGGSIGMTDLALAAPDGYTMGQTTVPDLISQRFGKEPKWSKDSFDYIGNISGASSTLTVRTDSELKTFQDFLDSAKASATPLNVGIGGVGNDDHLSGLRLIELSGVKFNLIPFGSGADTRLALLGGHVDLALMSSGEFGRDITDIRPLAIAREERSPALPDTPTFRELGLDVVMGSRLLLAAPKGLPAAALAKWRDCVAQVTSDKDFIAAAEQRAVPLLPMTADQTRAFVEETDAALTSMWAKEPWIK
jgi:tripartite-type tricarboxylate transporter receptor subunit TctC